MLWYTINVFAQTQNDTTSFNEPTDCEYIAGKSTYFVMKYFVAHDYDSVDLVLRDWESACGKSEPIIRMRVLMAISQNKFDESVYDSTIIYSLLNYMDRMDTAEIGNERHYENNKAYFGYIPVRGEYDYFTQSIADTLLLRTFYNPAELLFTEIYSNVLPNPIYEIQLDSIYKNTLVKSYYSQEVDIIRREPDFNLCFSAGLWMPQENASLLGNHPIIGGQAGFRKDKMTYNLSLAFRVLKSRNQYVILVDGVKDSTNYFLGGYIGIDIDRSLISCKKHQIDLLAGIGYDSFEALYQNTDDDNPDNDTRFAIGSVNMNFGLGYRYYYKARKYIGLQAKYNVVNYSNNGGTNLAGNCLTVSIIMGGLTNPGKYSRLDDLKYIGK